MWGLILLYIFLRPFISGAAFRVADPVINLAFLAVGSFYIYTRRKHFRRSLLDVGVCIFISGLILSALASANPARSLQYACQYVPLILLCYAARLSDNAERLQLIKVLIASSILVCLWSLDSLFTISSYLLDNKARFNIDSAFVLDYLSRGRAFAPFITPNLLAGYLAMSLFIGGSVFFDRMKTKKRDFIFFTALACMMLCPTALFFTKSVGGWGTLLLSFLFIAAISGRINKKAAAVSLIILALFIAIFAIRTNATTAANRPAFSIQKRISYWQDTVRIIRSRPITGTGPGNFIIRDSLSAHNSYLQAWAEIGILGFAGWLAMIFIFLKNAIKKLKPAKNNIVLAGLLGAGTVFILHNIFDFPFFVPQVSFLWWALLGLTDG